MRASAILAVVLGMVALSLPACQRMRAEEKEQSEQEHHKIVVTSPMEKDVFITQQYVCQIHARRHIEVCALQDGYLEQILVKEGQAVKKDDVMFKIYPVLYKARLKAAEAEAQVALIKFQNTDRLYKSTPPVVSYQEVALAQAELDKANAEVQRAKAEVDFTTVTAKFDGIVDRLFKREGSLIEKKDVLTTLSDTSVMWVYFNVPEARYLEYKAHQGGASAGGAQQLKLADSRIELVLANGSTFKYDAGDTVTVEGKFNNETGNIPFRADFPNPEGLLRHGQTGTVLIRRSMKNALVIPQRASYEILANRYVWVVGEDHVVHHRPITIKHELEDIFVIESGLDAKDKIVLEGLRQVHEGQKLEEYEFEKPEEALAHQKFHAE